MTDMANLPIAVIDAGPVDFAALHLVERGMTPIVFAKVDGKTGCGCGTAPEPSRATEFA